MLIQTFLGGFAINVSHGWPGCPEVGGSFLLSGQRLTISEHFEKVAVGCQVEVPVLHLFAQGLDLGMTVVLDGPSLVLTADDGRVYEFTRCTTCTPPSR